MHTQIFTRCQTPFWQTALTMAVKKTNVRPKCRIALHLHENNLHLPQWMGIIFILSFVQSKRAAFCWSHFFYFGISNPTSSHHQFNIVPRVKWEFDPEARTEVSIQQWFDYHIIISRLRRRTLSVCWTITSSVYTVTCLIHSYLFCLNVWPFVNLLQTICFTASLKTILIFLTAFSFKPNYYF